MVSDAAIPNATIRDVTINDAMISHVTTSGVAIRDVTISQVTISDVTTSDVAIGDVAIRNAMIFCLCARCSDVEIRAYKCCHEPEVRRALFVACQQFAADLLKDSKFMLVSRVKISFADACADPHLRSAWAGEKCLAFSGRLGQQRSGFRLQLISAVALVRTFCPQVVLRMTMLCLTVRPMFDVSRGPAPSQPP